MTVISAEDLAKATGIPLARASQWAAPLNQAMARFGIDTPERRAGFLSQVAHESALLTQLAENLNYSADALLHIFPRHFDQAAAHAYQRNPQRIANRVYAGRMGNGDEASGDGYRFRGRGLIQITGRDNYRSCGAALNEPLLETPELLSTPADAALSAAWFWSSHGLNDLADRKDVAAMTKRINGGIIGLEDRERLFAQATDILSA